MERTGTYHLPVERYFKENEFNTLVINSYIIIYAKQMLDMITIIKDQLDN